MVLKTQTSDFKKQNKDLKEIKDALDFGQAGFLFEQRVEEYVLPEGICDVEKINVYGNMIEWLNEKESEEKDGATEKAARIMAKEKAKERWEEVKGMVDWNKKHKKVLKYMKRQRINFAHPNVDLNQQPVGC